MEPAQFLLRQGQETLTPLAGLALVGKAIARFSQLRQRNDPRFPVRSGLPNSDVLIAYLGLLCQGKSDLDTIERFRQDRFFHDALGLRAVPSSPTLRQRLDVKAEAFLPVVDDESLLQLLKQSKVPVTPLSCGWVPLYRDVFPRDNLDTRKEGIGWIYAGFVDYAPIAAYLGQEGWCIGMERHRRHPAKRRGDGCHPGSRPARALPLTQAPLLLRLDAGLHSRNIVQAIARHDHARRQSSGVPVALLVKGNRRGQDLETLIQRRRAQADALWDCPRPGKRVTV